MVRNSVVLVRRRLVMPCSINEETSADTKQRTKAAEWNTVGIEHLLVVEALWIGGRRLILSTEPQGHRDTEAPEVNNSALQYQGTGRRYFWSAWRAGNQSSIQQR